MLRPGESEKHQLLKEFAERVLRSRIGVPQKYVHREFPIGEFRFDVAAYPPPEANGPKSIGVECGNKCSTALKNKQHFESALKYVDMIIWLPYTIYESRYFDFMMPIYDGISTPPVNFEIFEDRFLDLKNVAVEEDVVTGLLIVKEGRFPELDDWQYQDISNNDY